MKISSNFSLKRTRQVYETVNTLGGKRTACLPNNIQNKFEELKLLIDSLKSQIFIVSERKIDPSYRDQQFELQGYRICRRDRANGGGGFIAYITATIPSKKMKLLKAYRTPIYLPSTTIYNLSIRFAVLQSQNPSILKVLWPTKRQMLLEGKHYPAQTVSRIYKRKKERKNKDITTSR